VQVHDFCLSFYDPLSNLCRQLDIVERFTLAMMLSVVAFRNLIELSGSEFDFTEGFVLPKSFGWFRGNNVLWTISYVSLKYTSEDSRSTSFIAHAAGADRDDIRDVGRLAKACFYNQV
jgi:hypothetical protein